MDRATLLRHLAEAERHVADGERHIARQEELINELRRDGHDLETASEVLATMQQSQVLHLEHRDRILREIDELE
ncbi:MULTISPECIES: hypothetical protein [unclassified Bradyrhizobium]|uniref:hypothetical protein n=1 Tax=unclassified Bradyrhizobium TaxID=2631580 RepID=UPI0015C97CDC|nr:MULTISPECIES: hypothetical protein [unclassified Bradyrhizobium]MBB4261442.1 hypothetical protein [Bradyrhizobium sp. CIR3A]NYG47692.1 hypothetical protein [Bradyrhizobium sp. IAR9]